MTNLPLTFYEPLTFIRDFLGKRDSQKALGARNLYASTSLLVASSYGVCEEVHTSVVFLRVLSYFPNRKKKNKKTKKQRATS